MSCVHARAGARPWDQPGTRARRVAVAHAKLEPAATGIVRRTEDVEVRERMREIVKVDTYGPVLVRVRQPCARLADGVNRRRSSVELEVGIDFEPELRADALRLCRRGLGERRERKEDA